MTGVTIREACESDIPAILQTYTAAGINGAQSFSVEEARESFACMRRYPSYRIFVAMVDEEVAGAYSLLLLDKLTKRGARSGVVEDVAVRPDLQGKGVGRAMMEHAREQCRLAGCYKLTLSSGLPRTGAHAFYDSLGFERHGYSFLIRP
ncbi:MAG TPA: GNAT family N-acetyltransferase [Bryobacteraceae bacterium]|nr:GNAT family N-acetyltransferase [Bryobacteraceae bacterium]